MTGNKGGFMKTLIKIVKLINGYERHYRVEGTSRIEIIFIARPCTRINKGY